jgi:hypothetical protein
MDVEATLAAFEFLHGRQIACRSESEARSALLQTKDSQGCYIFCPALQAGEKDLLLGWPVEWVDGRGFQVVKED